MSTMTPEAPAPRRPASGGRAKNLFTNKIGPLPMWAWVAIVGGGFLAYRWYEGYKNNQASTASTSTSSDQVPQFVNQTYTTVTPPSTSGTGTGSGNLIIPKEPSPLPGGTKTPAPRPGSGKVNVPNAVGQSQENASDVFEDAGLKLSGQPPVKGKVRTVISQAPKAGTSVDKGTVVQVKTRIGAAPKTSKK